MRLLLAALLALPALALAQGALTPPGAPAPTMKTLDQLEPRIPLQIGSPGVSGNGVGGFNISLPGSYYLIKNLTVATHIGIWIDADNVTIDLAGFTIASEAGCACTYAIYSPLDHQGNVVRNGHINSEPIIDGNGIAVVGPGFEIGIYGAIQLVSDVTIRGVSSQATNLVAGSIIRHCTAQLSGAYGLGADLVVDSIATECGVNGITGDTIIHCQGEGASGAGIRANNSAIGCTGRSTAGDGLISFGNAENSQGTSTGRFGLYCAGNALNCSGKSVESTGLRATVATGCSGASERGMGLHANRAASGSTGTTKTGIRGLFTGTMTPQHAIISLGTAENCEGIVSDSGTGIGLEAGNATNCHGAGVAGWGLHASTATGCVAESVDATALQVDCTSENSRGIATGGGYGLWCGGNALNCYGETASGNFGLWVDGTANTCRGKNNASATAKALHAGLAIGCTSEKGAIEAANRYLMPASP